MRWLPFDRRWLNPAARRARSASVAVHRGGLGIYLDGRGQNRFAQEKFTFIGWERFEVQFDGFFNIRDCLFKSIALRLTAFQFGAPSIKAVFVLFDNDARIAGHVSSVSCH